MLEMIEDNDLDLEDEEWLSVYSCLQTEENDERWCHACKENDGEECEFMRAARNALG